MNKLLIVSIVFLALLPLAGATTTFTVSADLHIADDTNTNLTKVKNRVDTFYDINADFAVLMGDIIHEWGAASNFTNFTQEILPRVDKLTFFTAGDHDRGRNQHNNYLKTISFPENYAFKYNGILYIFISSLIPKSLLTKESKDFIRYELEENSNVTSILLIQNPMYNTTEASTDSRRYYLDDRYDNWWNDTLSNYNVSLVIHANNHDDPNTETTKNQKYGVWIIAVDNLGGFDSTDATDAYLISINATLINISLVDLDSNTVSSYQTIDGTTSYNEQATNYFSYGGLIHDNQSIDIYSHVVYGDNLTLQMKGVYTNSTNLLDNPTFLMAFNNKSEEINPNPFFRFGGTTSYDWTWINESILNVTTTVDNVLFLISPEWGSGGAHGVIRAAPLTTYNFTVNMKASIFSVADIQLGFQEYYKNGTSIQQSTGLIDGVQNVNTTTSYSSYTTYLTTTTNTYWIEARIKLRNSSSEKHIRNVTWKVNGTDDTENAYIKIGGTNYGSIGTLNGNETYSEVIPAFENTSITGNVSGNGVVRWRIIAYNPLAFSLNFPMKNTSNEWTNGTKRSSDYNYAQIFPMDFDKTLDIDGEVIQIGIASQQYYKNSKSLINKTISLRTMSVIPSSDSINITFYNWTTAYKKWNESADNTSVTVTHTICDNRENSKMRLKILNTPSGKIYRYKNTNGDGCFTYTYTLGYANGTVTYILTQRGGPNLAVAATGGTGVGLLILYLYRLRRRRR